MEKFYFGKIITTEYHKDGMYKTFYGNELVDSGKLNKREIKDLEKEIELFCNNETGSCLSAAEWEFERRSYAQLRSNFPDDLENWFEI